MNDGKPNETVPEGKEDNPPVEDPDKSLSLYEKTNAATERLEKANAKTEELLNRQEKLYQNQKLGGTAGGRVEEENPLTEEQQSSNKRVQAVGEVSGAQWAKPKA